MDRFWKTLFDKEERTCFAATIYGTGLLDVNIGAQIPSQFFSINPMQASRKDENVTQFRNILLEFDIGSPAEQLEKLKGVPYSTLVWSGGKSHHAIISLDESCKTRLEYDRLVRRVYKKVPGVDKAVKNPSRLSRVPGVVRDNGSMQTLVDVVCRRTASELADWLGPVQEQAEPAEQRRSLALSGWTTYFIMFGAEQGSRSNSVFRAACDMLRHGYTEQQAYAACAKVVDLPETEICSIIRSAAKTAFREL